MDPDPAFERSGIAAASDLRTASWRELYERLAAAHDRFRAREREFMDEEYRYRGDHVRTWSRPWEYPYAYYHLSRHLASAGRARLPTVVDVGSGVTFFPFSVAQIGCNVICVDIDPVCEECIRRAKSVIPTTPGSVAFRLSGEARIPVGDAEADAVYSVSVLEHTPAFEALVAEMHRILKPGGLLVLTFDLDLRGDRRFGPDEHRRLANVVESLFVDACPRTTVHPRDILHSGAGPSAVKRYPTREILRRFINDDLLRRLRGKPPRFRKEPYRLAVEGRVLRKR